MKAERRHMQTVNQAEGNAKQKLGKSGAGWGNK